MVLTKARVPNLFGVIVGDGPLREELKRKAQTLKIDSFVKFLGFKENPLDYLAAFDVFCLSSKEEGLGTSLLDAMALRVPVVATNTGGIPELIENNVNGFLAEPQNPASLSEALEVCIRSVPIRPQIVQKGLEKAKQFDISHTINRMESIYKEMA
jgi:glycosyltransferase involved in cell wall biosynthesis